MATFRSATSSSASPFAALSSSAPPFTESATPFASRYALAPEPAARRTETRPAGWRRLPTGMRGVRLYVIASTSTRAAYWLADILREGGHLSRRFASELHARAWLIQMQRPDPERSSPDWEEMNGSLRATRGFRGE